MAREHRLFQGLPLPATGLALTFLSLGLVTGVSAGDPPKPALRVVHTDIDLKIEPDRGIIRETATLKLEGSGQQKVTLTLGSNLIVERTTAGTGVVEHRKAGRRLELIIDPPLEEARTFTFIISGRPRRGARDLVGPDWAAMGTGDEWYPQLPDSWATASVRVEVPDGWTAIGPGKPEGSSTPGNRTWTTSKPVHGIAVAAAPGLTVTDGRVVRQDFRLAAPATAPDATALAPRLTDPMAWYSGALAPYPFDGFNLAVIPGLPFFVQGSGVLAVPADVPLRDRGDAGVLLSGQWFGERLPGEGAWIESFAAWQAVVYARDRSLPVPARIASLRQRYLDSSPGSDVALSRAVPSTPLPVLIGKGSAAPDMVRLLVGNRKFFRAIDDLFQEPPGVPVSLDLVRGTLEKRARSRLEEIFTQWFDRTGVPELEVRMRSFPSATGGFRTDLELRQLRGVYTLSIDLVLRGGGRVRRETVEIDEEVTSLLYVLPFEPVRVEIDPLGKIFQRPPVKVDS